MLKKALRHVGGLVPGVRGDRRYDMLQQRLDLIEDRLLQVLNFTQRTHHFTFGSSATYVGNNRVLLRIVAGSHLFVLYVHADDKLISPGFIVNGGYEPDLTQYFVGALQPDSHCIDVGANVGYFSCLMAKYCPQGQVIGLEPNPPVHATAVDNILINGLMDHARILNAAASDKVGELTLFHRIGREGNTSIAACGDDFTSALQEPPEQAFQVPTVRVDDLRVQMGGRVDFLKVDVEGAEPLVLAGARETIAGNSKLRIVMEWAPAQISHAGFDIAGFVGEITAAGLRISVLTMDGPQPISANDLIGLSYRPGILLQREAA